MIFFKKSISVFLCVVMLSVSLFCGFLCSAGESDIYCDVVDGVLYIGGEGELQTCFKNDPSITEVYVERGITSLPDEAFKGCTNLARVTISNSVELIGASAFSGCTSLNDVRLSKNIVLIDENTFSGCTALSGIKIPEGAAIIKSGAFSGCSSLEYVILPNGISRIVAGAFDGCSSLQKAYYAGSGAGYNDISKPSGCFGNAEIICLSPELRIDRTYMTGQAVFSVVLENGTFSALDAQLSPQGDCSVYRVQANSELTASSNRKIGRISLVAEESFPAEEEIFKVTFNVDNCENYSVAVSFFSCTAVAENYEIEVPVIYNGDEVLAGGHSFSGMNVVTMPSAEGDGTAEAECECCGTVTKPLPFIFKNCVVDGSIVKTDSYALTLAQFRENYLAADFPSVVLSDTSFAGTGTAVTADYSDGIVLTYDVALTGDVDGDGFCDAQDSIYIACLCEGMLSQASFKACELAAADCCDDGIYDYADVSFAEQNGLI